MSCSIFNLHVLKHFPLQSMFESCALPPNGSFHFPFDITYMDSRSPHRCLGLYGSLLIVLFITRVHKLSRCREVERFWYNGELYTVSGKEWDCHSHPSHTWTSWFLIMSQHLGVCSVVHLYPGEHLGKQLSSSYAVKTSPLVAA